MPETKDFDLAFGDAHYKMFPELRYFTEGEAPPEDLKIYFRYQSGWPTTVVIAFSILSAYPLFHLFYGVFEIGRWYAVGLLVFVQIFINWLLLSLIIPRIRQRQIRRALRERLLELGIHSCRQCGYDMRGSPERCPECGTFAEG